MSEENMNVETPEVKATTPETAIQQTEISVDDSTISGSVASFLALKENNPTTFYGIIGGVSAIVVTLLALGFGGSDEILKKAESKGLAAGQKYTLKSPNVMTDGLQLPEVRLVATPGAIAAFDDDENKTEECRKFPVGTNVTVLDKQDQSSVTYAKVQIDEGSCSGTIGWVLGINL